jgi:hypothetical protein
MKENIRTGMPARDTSLPLEDDVALESRSLPSANGSDSSMTSHDPLPSMEHVLRCASCVVGFEQRDGTAS